MFPRTLPLFFKKALVKGINLSDDEVILQTIYNSNCLSRKGLWRNMPWENMVDDIPSRCFLKTNYLLPMLNKGYLYKNKPEDNVFKKGGFSVNVEKAYEKKLPYTMMGLDPLPAVKRMDYVSHIILFKDPNLPYEIFSEDEFTWLDKVTRETVHLAESLLEDKCAFSYHSDLILFLSKFNSRNKNVEEYQFLIERRMKSKK